jgi:two-component system sensor histidine kinase UhpB
MDVEHSTFDLVFIPFISTRFMHAMNNVSIPHAIREQERARMARDLHDEVGGNLAAIKLALSTLIERLPAEPHLTEQADYLNELVDHTIGSLKRFYNGLRPAVLDFGLIAALEWLVAEFCKQQKTTCALKIKSDNARLAAQQLSDDQATALFRISQEALTNVSKHSGASSVAITVQVHAGKLRLSIEDNGVGLSSRHHSGMGLKGMRDRANEIGAAFETESSENCTVISTSVTLPDLVIPNGEFS